MLDRSCGTEPHASASGPDPVLEFRILERRSILRAFFRAPRSTRRTWRTRWQAPPCWRPTRSREAAARAPPHDPTAPGRWKHGCRARRASRRDRRGTGMIGPPAMTVSRGWRRKNSVYESIQPGGTTTSSSVNSRRGALAVRIPAFFPRLRPTRSSLIERNSGWSRHHSTSRLGVASSDPLSTTITSWDSSSPSARPATGDSPAGRRLCSGSR